MMRRKFMCAWLAILWAPAGRALDPNYFGPIKEYAGQMDREPIDIRNTDFFSVEAKSVVNKAKLKANESTRDKIVTVNASSRRGLQDGNGDVNIASPIIEGGNNGKVIVVVERGAFKGNITTVQK